MMTRQWIVGAAAMAGLIGLSVGTAHAAPLNPAITPPPGAPPISLSVIQGGADVADTYLPEVTIDPVTRAVTGKRVTLRINAPAGSAIRLASSTRFLGTCTNFSSPATDTLNGAPKDDFELVGNDLISWDCGGRATLEVSSGGFIYTFRLPKDDNDNFIADSFEGFPNSTLDPAADPDRDGLSNFDEYRGFIVSGKLVRGDPNKKDFFVFLVNPPTGASLLGKLPTEQRTVYPIDGTPLTANIDTLSVARVHLIGMRRDANGNVIFDGLNKTTDEMVDRLVSYALVAGRETWVYRTTDAPTPTITIINLNRKSAPADDRVINKNKQYGPPQKAARTIESLDVTKSTPIGSSSVGSPNSLNEAVIYTQRIVNFVTTSAPTTETRLYYKTHDGVAWQPYVNTFTVPGVAGAQPITRNYIISKLMQFVFAHETGGHDVNLTVTASTIGFHDPTGTGGMLDNQIEVDPTTDNTAANPPGLKFRIPSRYLPGHLEKAQVAP